VKIVKNLLLFLFVLATSISFATAEVSFTQREVEIVLELQPTLNETEFDSVETRVVKFKRGKAIVFTLLTGLLGGHRVYFGTHHRTPILYSITFGGLGILPLIDLVHIIFTKDLSRYEHKSQVIMWGR
jgi:hypothetical protein